jgi:hypothetical protein
MIIESQHADAAYLTLRQEREVKRAKSKDVFAQMMANTKDPSSELALPAPGKLARARAVRTTKSKTPHRGRGKEQNKRISKTSATVRSIRCYL